MMTIAPMANEALLVEDFTTAFCDALVGAQLVIAALIAVMMTAGLVVSWLGDPQRRSARFAH